MTFLSDLNRLVHIRSNSHVVTRHLLQHSIGNCVIFFCIKFAVRERNYSNKYTDKIRHDKYELCGLCGVVSLV